MAGGPVEEIKDRLNIIDVISPVVSLKKAGHNYKGLCPFHSDKSPSFIVFPDKGNYHCFGCGANGDIFTFLMKTQNLDFPEALRVLAQRAGIDLPEFSSRVKDSGSARLIEVNTAAMEYYRRLLLESTAATAARNFLKKRGINSESVHRFSLGYALDSWDGVSNHLVERGYSIEDISAAGLLVEKDGGRHYDRFRGRVMFPIRDLRGRVIGFGARVLDDSTPKFINSPETEVFTKGAHLYGLDLAAPAIRQANKAVVVEGYIDVLIGHQYGAQYMVAALGTALTDRQVSILKKLSRNIYLALDPDEAGQEATLRGLEVLRQTMADKVVPVPTWKGLVRSESRLDADIRIVSLPQGHDPDELIRKDVDEWQRLVSEAKPVVDYYFDVLLSDLDLDSAKGKSEAVKRLAPVIREVGDQVQQWHYIQELAKKVGTGEQVLAAIIARAGGRSGKKGREQSAPELIEQTTRRRGLSMAEYCLVLLLRHPELARLPECIEPDHVPKPEVEAREILRNYLILLASGVAIDRTSFRASLDDVLGEFLDDLERRAMMIPTLPEGSLEMEATSLFAELRRSHTRERVKDLEELIGDAEAVGDREFRARVGDLLRTQLEAYERGNTKSRIWK